jgi:predicted neutral ceramidase superfamily lipid hydrolase
LMETMRENVRRSVLLDFLLGGTLIAGAVLLADILNPWAGGVLAGAPIRSGLAICLYYAHTRDTEKTAQLARGVLLAMISNVFFALTLYLTLPRLGFVPSIVSASLVFLAAVALIELLGAL